MTLLQLVGGYQINNGDLTTMTPLQLIAVTCMTKIIYDYKCDNKPFAVI